MREWLFSDMGLLFSASWIAMLVAISYAAFRRDLEPSKALSSARNDSRSRVTSVDASAG